MAIAIAVDESSFFVDELSSLAPLAPPELLKFEFDDDVDDDSGARDGICDVASGGGCARAKRTNDPRTMRKE